MEHSPKLFVVSCRCGWTIGPVPLSSAPTACPKCHRVLPEAPTQALDRGDIIVKPVRIGEDGEHVYWDLEMRFGREVRVLKWVTTKTPHGECEPDPQEVILTLLMKAYLVRESGTYERWKAHTRASEQDYQDALKCVADMKLAYGDDYDQMLDVSMEVWRRRRETNSQGSGISGTTRAPSHAPRVNTSQRWILVVAACVGCVMVLRPPWSYVFAQHGRYSRQFAGYYAVFSSPPPFQGGAYNSALYSAQVAWDRLWLQLGALAAVTMAVSTLARSRLRERHE